MNIISVKNPVYSSPDNSSVDCQVTFDNDETYPFTARANDPMEYGVQIFEALLAGNYGKIAPYTVQEQS